MTAHASLDMAVKAIQADVYDYMIKPIDSNHLKRSVANALEQYRLITENKQLVDTLQRTNRELAQLNEFKSKFFSIVTHDLRSPLTSIRGYAQLMMQKPEMGPDQLLQFLKIIISQSDQLGNLINDLMDVVSIQSGKLRVERALVDPGRAFNIGAITHGAPGDPTQSPFRGDDGPRLAPACSSTNAGSTRC
jgi:signal transduction histidine kinase